MGLGVNVHLYYLSLYLRLFICQIRIILINMELGTGDSKRHGLSGPYKDGQPMQLSAGNKHSELAAGRGLDLTGALASPLHRGDCPNLCQTSDLNLAQIEYQVVAR